MGFPQSNIDWSKYMEGLQGKANIALDNISGGRDVVIEYKINPDGSWYRKYKSGWLEQGGYIGTRTGMTETVHFSAPFKEAGFYSSVSSANADTGAVYRQSSIANYTTTSMTWIITEGASRGLAPFYWYACGQGA